MTNSPLDRPREVYRPFTCVDSDALRKFVADVRRLGRMRVFDQVPTKASVTIGEEGEAVEMDEPDDEAVRAAVTAFRQIYNHPEPTSAVAIIKLLKRSAHDHGGPKTRAALDALDALRVWANDELKRGIGVGIVLERGDDRESVDPAKILDAYFHGHYLHSGNEKAELAQVLDELAPWGRYTLYNVMWALTRVYWVIANNVDLVLAVPELLDSDAGYSRTGGPG